MAKKKKSKTKDTSETAGEDTPKGKGGGLLPKLVMVVAMGLVSFGTVYLLPRPDNTSHDTPASEEAAHHDKAPDLGLVEDTGYLELTPLTITLQDDLRVLKIGITLEILAGEEDYIDPSDPKIRDAFMGYLRALRLEQIEDAAFMAQMRAQLLRRAQLILGQDTVRGILITDFLVR